MFFEHDYADCLSNLEKAKQLDPDGDATNPRVQNLRAELRERLGKTHD